MAKQIGTRAEVSDLSGKGQYFREGAVVVLLLFLSAVPYLQSLNFEFVNYDDPLHVSAQPAVLEGLSAESVGWATKATPGNLWHPLTWISYMAEVQWFGGGAEAPGVHHGGNLLLYAITILLLYLLVRRLGIPMLWASIGVLLFALHPLHSEPVAWVSARKDLLSGVFILASLLGYVLGGSAAGRARWCWKSVSLIAFAAALLSKPSAVVLPALLILLDWFPLRQCGFEKAGSGSLSWKAVFKTQLRSKGVYFLMALVTAGVAISVQSGGTHRDFAGGSSLASRLSDAPGHLAFYFQRLVWPTDLVFEYQRPAGPGLMLYTSAGLVLVLGASWLAWKHRQRFPEIMLGWVWVLVCMAPVLGLVYIGSSYTADRYWYLALAGPALAVAFLLQRVTRFQGAVIPGTLLVLLVLGTLSFRQAKVWSNDSALFHHAVAVDPNHLTALGNLGSYYRVQKDDEQALKYYLAALEVNPRDHIVHYNIAHIRNNQGDRAGSIAACRECLNGYPNYARAHFFLGALLADPAFKETYAPEEALTHLKKACDLDPQEPRFALNYVYNLHRQGRREDAREATARALENLPPSASKVSQRLKQWLRESKSQGMQVSPQRRQLRPASQTGAYASTRSVQAADAPGESAARK